MEKKLEFNTKQEKIIKVGLEINCYTNNRCIYIGLTTGSGESLQLYADVTVNLAGKAPDYCGYLNNNNLPQLKEFIETNGIGEFTGLTKQSGFCEYPLYLFQVDRLRELCPNGMLVYEQGIGKGNKEKKEEKPKNR